MLNSNNLALLALLFSTLPGLAQFGQGVAAGTWEPLAIRTKARIVADWNPGMSNTVTLNGAGISSLANRVPSGNALLQATAANQPLISRTDNSGNLIAQSTNMNVSPWTKVSSGTGSNPTVTPNAATDPLGGSDADRVVFNKGAGTLIGDASLLRQTITLTPSSSCIYSVWMKSNDTTNYIVALRESNLPIFSNYTASSTWQECTLIFTNAAAISIDVCTRGTLGTSNYCDVLLWGPSFRLMSWNTNYIQTSATIAVPGLNNRATAYFDGAAYYLKANAFTLNQPTEAYRVCVPWTWTLNDSAFDGNASGSGKLYQSATTPRIRFNAGTDGTELVPPALGIWRVTSVVFDGNNSRISTNRGAYAVSAAGAGNMGGFTLGANGANTAFWHGQVQRQILCNRTNLTQESSFIQWGMLKNANVL